MTGDAFSRPPRHSPLDEAADGHRYRRLSRGAGLCVIDVFKGVAPRFVFGRFWLGEVRFWFGAMPFGSVTAVFRVPGG